LIKLDGGDCFRNLACVRQPHPKLGALAPHDAKSQRADIFFCFDDRVDIWSQ